MDKHIIQTCGQRACVCDYGTKKQIFKYIKAEEYSASETGGKTKELKWQSLIQQRYHSLELPLLGDTKVRI